MTRTLWLALALSIALSGGAPDASAQLLFPDPPPHVDPSPEDEAAASAAYQEAAEAWGADELYVALEAANRAWAAVPNASTALIRATVLAALDRPRDAFRTYLQAANLDPTADEQALIAEALSDSGASLKPPHGWLKVACSVPGAQLRVAGTVVALPATVALPAGQWRLEASAPGHEPGEERVALGPGAGVTVSFELTELQEEAEVEPEPEPPPTDRGAQLDPLLVGDAASEPDAGADVAGWVLLGSAGATVAAGVGLTIWAGEAQKETARYATPGSAPPGLSEPERMVAHAEAERDLETRRTAAIVLYAAGGAAAIAGVTLLLIGDGDAAEAESEEPTVHATGSVLPGGAGLLLRGTF